MNAIRYAAVFYLTLSTINTVAMDQNGAQRNTTPQQRSAITTHTTISNEFDEQYHINIAFGYDDDTSSSDDDSFDDNPLRNNGNAAAHNPATATPNNRPQKRARFSDEDSDDSDSSDEDDSDIERMLNN